MQTLHLQKHIKVITNFENFIWNNKPDVFILGDTNTIRSYNCKNKIQSFILKWKRCFDNLVPEEINRKIIDHISDVNFTYTSISKQNLISEGIHSENS